MTDENTPRTLTQLARELGMARSTLHSWMAAGDLKVERRRAYGPQGFVYVSTMAAIEAANRSRQIARSLKGWQPVRKVSE